MLPLERNGYTEQEIINSLHAKKGSRKIDFKYNLLDKNNVFLKELSNVLEGGVKYASFNDIKRTATFKIVDDGSINFLSDRIQPVLELEMGKKIVNTTVQPTFNRGSNAYLSDGTLVTSGQPRYEKGKYGKGLMLEEATTNLVPNPLVKTDLTAIAVVNGGGAVSSVSRVTSLPSPTEIPFSTGVKHTTTTAGDSNLFFNQLSGGESANSIPVLPNTIYTISAWVYIESSTVTNVNLRPIEWTSASGLVKDNNSPYPATTNTVGKWVKFSAQLTTQATTGKMTIRFRVNGTGDVYVTGVQLEQKAYGTSFTEGSRAGEQLLVYTKDVLNPREGTIEIKINPTILRDWNNLLSMSVNNGRFLLWFSAVGNVYWDYGTINNSVSTPNKAVVGEFCDIAIRWSAKKGTRELFVNGQLIGSKTFTPTDKFGATMQVSINYGCIVDDFRISSIARSDEEILNRKDAPLKVDKYTTYLMDFENNLTSKTFSESNKIEFPLGVFLLASPKRSDNNNNVERSIDAYDGLLILIDDKLQDPYTVTAGTNYKTAIISLLQGAGITQYIIEDTTKTLTTTQVFEIGKSKLSVINELISQINFTPIRVDVYGNFVTNSYIAPSSRGVEYTYKDDSLSVTYQGMVEELDSFNVPNKWVIVATNSETAPLKSVYTNTSADSVTSTVNRGRTIVDYREIDNIADQQSLDAYTLRIANESSQIFGKLQFDTAIMPMHDYMDLLKIEYTKLGINDKYVETDWEFNFEAGAKMKHSVRKVVNI